MTRHHFLTWAALAATSLSLAACPGPDPSDPEVTNFSVRVERVQSLDETGFWRDHDLLNLDADPLPYAVPAKISVQVIANPTGRLFNGFIRFDSVPGEVVDVSSDTHELARSGIRVVDGEAFAELELEGAFGETRILVEDVGHVPGPAHGAQCDDSIDNDGDGLIDYPDDPGCFLRNDNGEGGGTHAVGVSEPLIFNNPRLAHVQGCDLVPDLSSQAITVERGSIYVTAVTVNGFYATDYSYMNPEFVACDPIECCAGGRFSHIYAYNFNTPQGLRVCDRLEWVGGIVDDFFGFTELSFPSWGRYDLDNNPENGMTLMRKEPGEITATDCPINSTQVTAAMLPNRLLMETYESALVHVEGAELPTEWVNCDYNDNGEVAYNSTYDEFTPADEVRALLGERYFDTYCTPREVNGVQVCSEVECNDTCVERVGIFAW